MPSPYRDKKRMKETWEYHQKGLSVRQIARVMKKHTRTIQRWINYVREDKVSVDKISTNKT